MTTLDITSPAGAAMQELADIIANCAAFQEECRTEANPDETAASFVHFPVQEFRAPNKFPFAVFNQSGAQRVRHADGTHLPSGVIMLQLGKKIPPAYDIRHEELSYSNFENAIIDAIQEVSGSGGHFVWTATQTVAPAITTPMNTAAGDSACPVYCDSHWDLEWSPL